jgi:hypothetical protein
MPPRPPSQGTKLYRRLKSRCYRTDSPTAHSASLVTERKDPCHSVVWLQLDEDEIVALFVRCSSVRPSKTIEPLVNAVHA